MRNEIIADDLLKIAKEILSWRQRRVYRNDPHWVYVKYPTRCAKCHHKIEKGEEAFYYPREKKFYCKKNGCGEDAEQDFQTMSEAEDYYGGNW